LGRGLLAACWVALVWAGGRAGGEAVCWPPGYPSATRKECSGAGAFYAESPASGSSAARGQNSTGGA